MVRLGGTRGIVWLVVLLGIIEELDELVDRWTINIALDHDRVCHLFPGMGISANSLRDALRHSTNLYAPSCVCNALCLLLSATSCPDQPVEQGPR